MGIGLEELVLSLDPIIGPVIFERLTFFRHDTQVWGNVFASESLIGLISDDIYHYFGT